MKVFDMWLAPFIQEIGWSFTELSDDLSGTRWNVLLGGIRLYIWHQVIWSRLDVEFTKIEFNPFTAVAIKSIIDHCVHNLSTGTANLQNTKERFRVCTEFVRAHQTIPKPIVGIARKSQLEVLDGNHRIAALLSVGVPKDYKLPIWIAHPG
jgi:hypothetical protein